MEGEQPDILVSRLLGTELGTQATWVTSCPMGREGETGSVCLPNRTLKASSMAEGKDF